MFTKFYLFLQKVFGPIYYNSPLRNVHIRDTNPNHAELHYVSTLIQLNGQYS